MSGALRYVEKLANAPWLCSQEHLEFLHGVFLRYVDRAASGQSLDKNVMEQQLGRPLENTREVTVKGGVARIPVEGTIVRRAGLFTEVSGGVSAETLMKDLETAYNDASIHSILFVFDSPGGELAGINELAGAIRAKRDLGEKPLEAYCNGDCASGAYWLASATQKITTDATGTLGSIGVVTRVSNPEAAGRQPTLEFWNARSPKKRVDPTTKSGAEAIQGYVDELGDEFIRAVADNRGVSFETVVSDYGQGFILAGRRAVEVGLADEIGSEEGVFARLRQAEPAEPAFRLAARASPIVTSSARSQERSESLTKREAANDQSGSEKGVLARIRALVVGVEEDAAKADPLFGYERTDLARAAEPEKEGDSGHMEETATETREEAEMDGQTNSHENSTAVSVEELNDLRAQLEAERDRREEAEGLTTQNAKMLREQGITRMLEARQRYEKDGRTVSVPTAKVDAAKVVFAALAGSEGDPIALSADGSASFAEGGLGKAVEELLTPWEPIELGERGVTDVTGLDEDDADAKDARIQAVADEKGISWRDAAIELGEGLF